MALLQMSGVDAGYGPTRILRHVDLDVGESEIVALLGRNGVGKTTLLRTIVGLTRLFDGRIALFGQDVARHRPAHLARLGVSLVPDHRGVFPALTVAQSLRLGREFGARGRPAVYDLEDVLELFPRLRERLRQPCGTLSGGERQMMAIARALLTRPRLLLIDELSEGIQPSLVERLAYVLAEVGRRGTSVLFVEQNVTLALAISQRSYVVENGEVVASGPSAEFRTNPEALHRYMVL